MFIKNTKLEGVLKKAYKGAGIRIERTDHRLIVATARLYIEANVAILTNDFKAAVVRYTGEMPKIGATFTVSDEETKVEDPGKHDKNFLKTDIISGKDFEETAFTYMGDMVLQADEDGQIITVPMREWQVFDINSQEEMEEPPLPAWHRWDNMIVNSNEDMAIGYLYKTDDDILSRLQKVRMF